MKYCSVCGAQLPDTAIMCYSCKTRFNTQPVNNIQPQYNVQNINTQKTNYVYPKNGKLCRNKLSIVAAVLFILALCFGSLYRSKTAKDIAEDNGASYGGSGYERSIQFSIQEVSEYYTIEADENYRYSSKVEYYEYILTANFLKIIICTIIIFLIYAFYRIPYIPFRIVLLILTTASLISSLILFDNKNSGLYVIGISFILVIGGIVVGFISMYIDSGSNKENIKEQKILDNGGWECSSCGKIHSYNEETCSCGMTKLRNSL